MLAGKMRHRITIQENRPPQDEQGRAQRDDYGAPLDSWVDIRACWASIEPLSGREYFAAAQIQAEQVTRFRIRYPWIQIWPGMRIKYRDPALDADRFFNIQAVIDPDEMHVELQLMATDQAKPLSLDESSSSSGAGGGS
jgi:SPP1 family predicted phage head-tail adaptor